MNEGVRFSLPRWRDAAREIEAAWRALEERAAASFWQTLAWQKCTLELFPDAEERVGLAFSGDEPVGVFPLRVVAERMGGLPVRTLLVAPRDHTCADWLLDLERAPGDLVARFAEFAAAEAGVAWDCIRMPAVPDGSATLRSLAGRAPERTIVDVSGEFHVLPLRGTHEEYLSTLSPNFRANLRKARNRLREAPGIEFRTFERGPALRDALEEFLRLEAAGWKGAAGAGTDLLSRPKELERLRRRVGILEPLGRVRVNLLACEGRTIAAQWAWVDRDAIHLFKIAYDESRSKLSPGNMLLERLLLRAREAGGIEMVDLESDAAWHLDWKPETRRLRNVRIFAPTARGRLGYAALRARSAMRGGGKAAGCRL